MFEVFLGALNAGFVAIFAVGFEGGDHVVGVPHLLGVLDIVEMLYQIDFTEEFLYDTSAFVDDATESLGSVLQVVCVVELIAAGTECQISVTGNGI